MGGTARGPGLGSAARCVRRKKGRPFPPPGVGRLCVPARRARDSVLWPGCVRREAGRPLPPPGVGRLCVRASAEDPGLGSVAGCVRRETGRPLPPPGFGRLCVRASAEGPGLGSVAGCVRRETGRPLPPPGVGQLCVPARRARGLALWPGCVRRETGRPLRHPASAGRACQRGGAGQREADVPRRGIACGGTSPVRRGIACGNTSPVLRGIARGNTSPARRSIACGNTSPARRALRKRLSARARGLGRISQSAPLHVRSSFQNVPSAVDKTVDLRYDMDGFSQSGGSLYVQPYPGGHHEPDAKSHIFGALPSQPNMEAYRSGHNGPDSKSGSPQGLVGSNPTASAK